MKTVQFSKIITYGAMTIVLAFGLAGTAAIAQSKGAGDHHNFSGFKGRMAQRLGLSQQQAEQIRKIRNEARSEAKAIWSNDNQSVGAMKNQLKQLRTATKQKISSVLTPDQRAMAEKMHVKGHGRSAGKSGPPPSA